MSSKSIWKPILERMEKRLAGWKGKYLCKGGMLVLSRRVFSRACDYFFSMFAAPSSFVNRMEKIQRKFLWQTDQ